MLGRWDSVECTQPSGDSALTIQLELFSAIRVFRARIQLTAVAHSAAAAAAAADTIMPVACVDPAHSAVLLVRRHPDAAVVGDAAVSVSRADRLAVMSGSPYRRASAPRRCGVGLIVTCITPPRTMLHAKPLAPWRAGQGCGRSEKPSQRFAQGRLGRTSADAREGRCWVAIWPVLPYRAAFRRKVNRGKEPCTTILARGNSARAGSWVPRICIPAEARLLDREREARRQTSVEVPLLGAIPISSEASNARCSKLTEADIGIVWAREQHP